MGVTSVGEGRAAGDRSRHRLLPRWPWKRGQAVRRQLEALAGGDLARAIAVGGNGQAPPGDTARHVAAGLARLEQILRLLAQAASSFDEAAALLAARVSDVHQGLDRTEGDLGRLEAATDEVRAILVETLDGQKGLEQAAAQVAEGAEALAKDAESLAESAPRLEGAATRLAEAVTLLRRAVGRVEERLREAAARLEEQERGYRDLEAELSRVSSTWEAVAARLEQVTGLAETIHDVAEQTNLLALNAAIESARAGEAGRGFAVVAEEVSRLADRTGRSATEVGAMIRGIAEQSAAMAEALDRAGSRAREGMALRGQLHAGLAELTQAVGEATRAVLEVQEIGGQVAREADGASRLAQNLSALAEENTAVASEMRGRFEHLEKRAEEAGSHTAHMFATVRDLIAGVGRGVETVRSLFPLVERVTALKAGLGRIKAVRLRGDLPAEFMPWTEDYRTGVPEMDAEHRELVRLVNETYAALVSGAAGERLDEILAELLRYAETHLAHEEALLHARRYPGFERHKAIHDRLKEQAAQLHARWSAGGPGRTLVAAELLSFLQEWLDGHILHEDRKYGAYLADSPRVAKR